MKLSNILWDLAATVRCIGILPPLPLSAEALADRYLISKASTSYWKGPTGFEKGSKSRLKRVHGRDVPQIREIPRERRYTTTLSWSSSRPQFSSAFRASVGKL